MANNSKTFDLQGGEDFVSTPMSMPNGMAKLAQNFEQTYETGYTRIAGYRKLVNLATPGEGKILGTFMYDNDIYMFRNQVGGASTGLWRATPAEWNEGAEPPVVTSNGSWTEISAPNIVDHLGAPVLLNPDGYYEFVAHNFQATAKDYGEYRADWTTETDYFIGDMVRDSADALGYGVDAVIMCENTHTSDDLLGDTTFWKQIEWDSEATPADPHDLAGTSGNLYGVDGKNPAFEFNGTTLTQIDSTYATDTPSHIEANGNRLVLGFRSGEIAISVLGNPHLFDPVYGAGSIGVTDYLTGLLAGPDNVLYILCKNKIYLYYGMSGPLEQTELKKHSKDVGAMPYTEQSVSGSAMFYDTWGITDLQATDTFGDVSTNALSANIQTLLTNQIPQCSTVLRDKAQYRLYFNTTTGVTASTTCVIAAMRSNQPISFTHALYPFKIETIVSGSRTVSGFESEWNIAGTFDGEVYHMDIGTNFDGEAYTSRLSLPYNHLGSPHRMKKIRKVLMNIDASSEVEVKGRVEFSYGREDAEPHDAGSDIANPTGANWGGALWNNFYWGSNYSDYVMAYVNGHGYNVSVTVASTSDVDRQYTVRDITYIYEYLRIEH